MLMGGLILLSMLIKGALNEHKCGDVNNANEAFLELK